MRWNGFHRRRNQRTLRVVGGLEYTVFNLAVAFTYVVLHFLRKSFQFLQVGLHGVCKILELERKQIRIRQAHYGGAASRRERTAVDEIRVAEMRVPVEIVVNGMVDAAVVFPAETDIERRHAVVLQKSCVIRTGTERGDAQVSALANFFALLRSLGIGDFVELLTFPNTKFRFRVENFSRDIVAEFFQRVRALDFEIAAAVGI